MFFRKNQEDLHVPAIPSATAAKRLYFLTGLIGVSLLLPVTATATTELVLQLDSSWRYDSNPLRLPESTDVRATLGTDGKSDTTLANYIKVALVHPLDSPETRLLFTGQLGHSSYRQLTQLDNTDYAFSTAFEWRSGDLWKGRLNHSGEQHLYDYLNSTLTTREMVHQATDSAELALRMTPEMLIPLVVSRRHIEYDTPTNWIFDSQERSLNVGVRYQSTVGSSLGVGLLSKDVSFPRRTEAQAASLDTSYQDNEIYLASDWQYSVLTRFIGRIALLQRAYATLNTKNFSALTTELQVVHDYSPKTRLTLGFWSKPYEITDATALYTLGTGAQVSAQWQVSEKTHLAVQASKELQRNQYANPDLGKLNPEISRIRLGGGVIYAVTRDLRLYVDGFRDRMDQGVFGSDIIQNTMRAGLEYTFENIAGAAKRTGLSESR